MYSDEVIEKMADSSRLEFHHDDGRTTVLGSGIDNMNFVIHHGELKILEGQPGDHIPDGFKCHGDHGYPACVFWQGEYCAYLGKTDADTIGNRVKACDVNKPEYQKKEE